MAPGRATAARSARPIARTRWASTCSAEISGSTRAASQFEAISGERAVRQHVRRLGQPLPLRHPQPGPARRPARRATWRETVPCRSPRVLHDVAESGDTITLFRISPPEPWRELRARRWAAIGKAMPRSELVGAGFLTSSSGLTVYRGDAYPAGFRGNLFLGEVANNLIHRMTVEADGVTFRARRADAGAEFVASTDTWFRPVNFVNAPDGTLHVLDMYRETIEHPWSIPDESAPGSTSEAARIGAGFTGSPRRGFATGPRRGLSQASTSELGPTAGAPQRLASRDGPPAALRAPGPVRRGRLMRAPPQG